MQDSQTLFSVIESNTPLFLDAYLLDGDRWIVGSLAVFGEAKPLCKSFLHD